MLLAGNVAEARYAERNRDRLLGVARQVFDEPKVATVIRDEHRLSERAQEVDARQEVALIDALLGREALQCHLHEDNRRLSLQTWLA